MPEQSNTDRKDVRSFDAVVVGAGAAGVGVAIALRDAGVENFIVLERDRVGASFASWPDETRFITPSFPTNSFGMVDLNSIALGVSPAHSLKVEHPTGKAYAAHLRGVAQYFQLPICENTGVLHIARDGDGFLIETDDHTLRTRHVIWAAGEFQYPRLSGFTGAELCRHTATIASYGEMEGDEFAVIGGYESGIDAAYHLALRRKRVRVFDSGCPWEEKTADPSIALSPFSLERMRRSSFKKHVELLPRTPINEVTQAEDGYRLVAADGRRFDSPGPPLFAGGFEGSHKLVMDLFERRDDGFPLLNERDESTIAPGVYLCGPAVRHDKHVFCFIYKYRQRFAVVAKSVATSLGLAAENLEQYRTWGMYLDDLSCCGEECVC
ncbi:MAG: NAD(P)/FAD-dependent oxidoreductase [Planctomycetota bacterium]